MTDGAPMTSSGAVAVPREAATVVLLRDGSAGIEAWLLRRVTGMAFAAGMTVFPGGAVDPTDSLSEASSGPLSEASSGPLSEVAAQLGTDIAHAGSLVCAAVREMFEEVGVLLASPPFEVPREAREAVENHSISFGDLLSEHSASVDVSAVRPWSRWITPDFEPRRYDTYFFVAAMPQEARADAVSSEASHAGWVSVDQAIAEYRDGQRPMLPPTVVTLTEVSQHSSVADVLAAAPSRSLEPINPVFTRDESGDLWGDFGNGTVVKLPPVLNPKSAS